MKRFSHLLVAFDGKEDSKEALKLAINLSKQLNAVITVAHVFKRKVVDATDESLQYMPRAGYTAGGLQNYPPPMASQTSFDEERKPVVYEDGAEEIVAEARMILEENNSTANIKILDGDPVDEITSFASEENVDLIVMGSRDISGLKKLLFGSVSEKVSHQTPIPVLIAK
ncbi:universal stress protein [Metabacillus arenae]|uniref:Universal stress protein n=1 Tax=Metabacillus arenae TaxID=2771434 RepID=A0A926NL58_9BACI|nr:universal stress protein [Metabacillus arenae]MBD1383396.1 universal stress protein [Metabacillus arenae]